MKTISHFLPTLPAGLAARGRETKRVVYPALFLFMAMLSNAPAQTSWQGSFGDWFIDSNWSNDAPDSGFRVVPQDAIINNGGTALLSSSVLGVNPARASDVWVGSFQNTSGTLLLTRSGNAPPAILHLQHLVVGWGTDSAGTVEISRGASMVSTNNSWDGGVPRGGLTYIGTGARARATLNVQDPDSSFQTDSLSVGGDTSSGTLNILRGARVYAHDLVIYANSVVDVNNGSSSVAGLMLVGGQSRPSPNGSLGDVLVGSTTGGRMEIRDGGTLLSLRGHIGFHPGSDGAVNVNGSDALWAASGSLFIGNAGVGSLEVLNGGSVSTEGHGYLGFAVNSSGAAKVSGAGSTLSIAQNLFIGGNGGGAGGSGGLVIQDGGVVSAATARLYAGGVLSLGANPTLNAPLTVTGGSIEPLADTTFTNNLAVELGGLYVYTLTRSLTLSGAISGPGILGKSGGSMGTLTLTGVSDYSGATILAGGKLFVHGSITSAVTVFSDATLGGNGIVGSVEVMADGRVAPGVEARNSPGRLTINGNYTQRGDGILNMEIGGYTAGAGGYDQLAVSGAATVNGTLNLKLVNGFRPVPGDTFPIITSTAATGNFATINSPGFTVTSAASASGIILTVTAIEPVLRILSIERGAADSMVIRFDAMAGKTYRLERNRDDELSDLSWAPIGEYTALADGPAVFSDPDAYETMKAFYRLRR